MDEKNLGKLCQAIRYDILTSTTEAESGHPTSSLSAVELLTTLFFAGFYHFDINNPKNLGNDHLIFSKGHASPLLYSLYHRARGIDSKKLMTLRKFASVLEGHPTPRFPYVDVATGSLGQGLSIGVGMALGIRLRMKNEELKIKRSPKVWVLLGDSEMAEGQIWEAMEIASFYKLNNLIGIIDVNRLGQNGQTMAGWDLQYYAKKAEAFGWEPIVVEDGNDIKQVFSALNRASGQTEKQPQMIIAKTIKGKGVSFIENRDNWHGKPLNQEELEKALKELGELDLSLKGKISLPDLEAGIEGGGLPAARSRGVFSKRAPTGGNPRQAPPLEIATREAYGDALVELGEENPNIVVLDGEIGNSTYQNKFAKKFPERFFQMFIAEQNLTSVAVGLQKIGFLPFISTFAAFLTRSFDQLRMAQYSRADLKVVGSHAGVSIGQDGPSQMGLEDITMMRSILNSIVLYPADGVSGRKLTRLISNHQGLSYLRTARLKTPIIYDEKEEFEIGGCKIHKSKLKNQKSETLIIAAGITLHEALKAQKELEKENIETTIVDLYSIKPIDEKTLVELIKQTNNVVVVEDHYPYGGIGEVISSLISNFKLQISNFVHLAVKKTPMSGSPEELLHYEEIDSEAIIKAVRAF
ncbi:transketolase [Candidatus Roizmanbacteria bacterium]|nr:transketolase [Candidatus Roizmanbacteria bacterium]